MYLCLDKLPVIRFFYLQGLSLKYPINGIRIWNAVKTAGPAVSPRQSPLLYPGCRMESRQGSDVSTCRMITVAAFTMSALRFAGISRLRKRFVETAAMRPWVSLTG